MRQVSPLLGVGVRGYVFVLRGTQLLVQLFIIYTGQSQLSDVRQSLVWPFVRQAYWCAIPALAQNTAAYGSEILRGGIEAVPHGVIEAGWALGLSRVRLFRTIVMPLVAQLALPAYGNEVGIMVKSIAVAGVMTLMDVTGIAHGLISETFRAFEVFACAGTTFLSLNAAIAWGVHQAERWLAVPGLGGASVERTA